MAGTLTHFYVMKKYFDTYGNNPIKFLKKESIKNSNYTEQEIFNSLAFLGSTGPDLFYMTTTNEYIADFHHYKNPGLFAKHLYEQTSVLSTKDKIYAKHLANGFLCHIATDLVIHPFVNSLVGKYQEHIITKVKIPGDSIITPNDIQKMTLSQRMQAHNIVEFAQDRHVLKRIFKQAKNAHSVIFTYPIEKIKVELNNILNTAIASTYGKRISGQNIQGVIDFYSNSNYAFGANIEDHLDYVLDDEYKHFELFLGHKNGPKTTFDTLIDKAVNLTLELITMAEAGIWDDIIKPLNLDTGLYTETKIDETNNQININFNSFEKLFG